jgi:hypothetical protein
VCRCKTAELGRIEFGREYPRKTFAVACKAAPSASLSRLENLDYLGHSQEFRKHRLYGRRRLDVAIDINSMAAVVVRSAAHQIGDDDIERQATWRDAAEKCFNFVVTGLTRGQDALRDLNASGT